MCATRRPTVRPVYAAGAILLNCGVQLKKDDDDRKEAQTLAEALEGIRRDGRALAQEIKDLTDQLGEGSHFVNELQKIVRNLEGGNEELLHALDDKKEAKKPCRVQKRTENVKRRRSPAPMFTIHEPETAWLESGGGQEKKEEQALFGSR
ncbi:hypothetical protein L596_009350 [Steinernema carpocapsae]|uniref:Uncharacterized protein n=1 Tax=Steinernema carpocapsae TaxID=34508 RepID=A0A4U5PGE3_STECR|nr:hypothetical protein L596_009350 [Steinernema carpocapsae]